MFTFFLFSMTFMYFTCKLSIPQFDFLFLRVFLEVNRHYVSLEHPRLLFPFLSYPKMPVPWEALIPFGLLDYLLSYFNAETPKVFLPRCLVLLGL